MELDFLNISFEYKEAGEDGHITGYGSVYGNVDGGGDIVEEGAFTKSIDAVRGGKLRPKMLWQHDPTQPIGVWESISSDSTGLKMTGRILKDVAKGREALALLKARAIDGLSIGYKTVDADFEENSRGVVRRIKEAELWETSIVTFPMNVEATVTDVKQLQSPRDVERLLRKAGVPGGFAKLVALHGYDEATKALSGGPRNADEAELDQEAMQALLKSINGLKEVFHA